MGVSNHKINWRRASGTRMAIKKKVKLAAAKDGVHSVVVLIRIFC